MPLSLEASARTPWWLPIATAVACLLATGIWYSGALSRISFRRGTIGPRVFFHRVAKGPYNSVGPLFREVDTFLRTHGLVEDETENKNKVVPAGIYYDDPKSVKDPNDLRYAVGFLVPPPPSPGDSASKYDAGGDGDDDDDDNAAVLFWAKWGSIPKSARDSWTRLDLPPTQTAVSSFPRTLGVVSCVLSAMKTYPAFSKQTEFTLRSGALEVYYPSEIVTHFPQENHERFRPEPKAASEAAAATTTTS
eukprot:jgi/Psemu1/290727/fgenesh1_pg.548_\